MFNNEKELRRRLKGGGFSSEEADVISEVLVRSQNRSKVYSDSGAIDPEVRLVVLTKATAATMTLAVPKAGQDGLELWVLNATAQAHTITTPVANSIVDGWGSDVGNRYTLNTTAGIAAVFISYNGKWYAGTTLGGGTISDV